MSLQFEMERRLILFTANTTMPDNSLLGYEGNPNNITLPISAPFSAGKTLIYNCPQGTHYLELLNGTLWFKEAMPNYWASVANAQDLNSLSGYANNIDSKINSLSGAAVLTYGDQYIDGQKIFRGEVRIKDLYVTGTETIVNTINTNVASNYLLLNATGGAIDAGIFIVTGLSSGASGMPLTGANNIGAVIGYDVPANRWVFGNTSRDSDLSQLEKIAGITDITNYSGFVNSNFYPLSNPSGFITGVDLSQYVTKSGGQFIDRPTLNGTGFLLSGEAASLPDTIIYTTGEQTISGLKDFTVRPTVNGTGVLLSGEASANLRYFPYNENFNFASNKRYSVATSNGVVTGLLPSNPEAGDEIEIYDAKGFWHINPLIVDNNGNTIEQKKEKLECNVRHGLVKLIYTPQYNIGWRIYPMPIHNVPIFLPPTIAITGYSLSGIVPFNIALTGIELFDPTQAPVNEWYWNLNTGDGYTVSGQTIAYTYLQTGLYNVTLSGVNVAGFDIESRLINVFLPYLPTVNVTANKLSGIIPLSVIFNAANVTQPAEYSPVNQWQWDPNNDGIIDGSGAASTTYTFNNAGIYNSTAYAINLGGTGSGSISINAFLPYVPNINIITNVLSGIIPLYVSFSGQNITQPAEYSPLDYIEWDADNDNIIDFTGITGSFVFSQTGLFNATSYASNLGGTGINSININAFLPYIPNINITTNTLSGIIPLTVVFTGQNITQPSEYSPVNKIEWDADNDTIIDFSGFTGAFIYSQTGVYNATSYASNLGGTGANSISINAFLPYVPTVNITGKISGIIPFTGIFTGINTTEPIEYSPVDNWYWDFDGDQVFDATGQSTTVTYNQTGIYLAESYAVNLGGTGIGSIMVDVFLPYVPTVSVTSNKLSGVVPFTGLLTATNTTQPAEYSPVDNWYWDFDGDQVFDATGQSTTVTYNQTGSYVSTAYGANLGGTGTGFITINIVEPLPPIPAIATYTASGYAPLTIELSGINLENNDISPVYHWYWDVSGDSQPEFDQQVISYTFNETGTYTFYLTATNNVGSGVASGIITIAELPYADEYSDYVTLLMKFNDAQNFNYEELTI
jgi:PKD repeat protein